VELSSTLSSQLNDPSLLTDWEPFHSSITTTTQNDDDDDDDDATDDEVEYFEVSNPACPDTWIARVPSFSHKAMVHDTVTLSHTALESHWRDGTTATHRAHLLRTWSQLLLTNREILDDLTLIMTLESGKPLAESRGELHYAASFLDYFAAEATRSTNAGGGVLIPTPFTTTCPPSAATGAAGIAVPQPRGQIMARHQAVGVCVLITPWNFPAAMMTRKVGPAMAAGCTAVLKPSELTPLTAIALCTLAYRAGIPPDVIRVMTASTKDTPRVGRILCQSPRVQKISSTGSTKVGKWLLEQSASTVKRVSLELGGNAPFIVFGDANIDQATTAAVSSKFRNAGQTCVCADRFLIHSSIYHEFLHQLISKTRMGPASRVGPGTDSRTTMGPLISTHAVESVHAKVQQAIQMGSTLHLGGRVLSSEVGSHFFEPTILSHVPSEADLWKMETFGPVIAIRTFDTDDEALEMANDSSVGLAAYFCTQDLGRAFRMAERYVSCVVSDSWRENLIVGRRRRRALDAVERERLLTDLSSIPFLFFLLAGWSMVS
jgi:succinate-semialdehyde dehydrogenase / glutarate-semialdehyde dehydrogenase